MRFLFLAFLAIPVIEIYFLISVGSVIGAGLTIGLILLTAFIGAFLVRSQGFSTYLKVQSMLSSGQLPAVEILEGLFLLVAGALLLTPGFVTDAIGFACLTPPLRRWVIRRMMSTGVLRGQMHTAGGFASGNASKGRVIDGESRDVDQ